MGRCTSRWHPAGSAVSQLSPAFPPHQQLLQQYQRIKVFPHGALGYRTRAAAHDAQVFGSTMAGFQDI